MLDTRIGQIEVLFCFYLFGGDIHNMLLLLLVGDNRCAIFTPYKGTLQVKFN